MRELAKSLQQFGAFILKTRLVREKAAPYWHRQPASTVVDEQGQANPLTALEQLRPRIRTRHNPIERSAATPRHEVPIATS